MTTERMVEVPIAIGHVWEFLADFRNTTQWHPATRSTVRVSGHGGVGTIYDYRSGLAGHDLQITYAVLCYEPMRQLRLAGRCDLLEVEDSVILERSAVGCRVRHDLDLVCVDPPEEAGPLGVLALDRRADQIALMLDSCLRRLPRTARGLSW